MQVAFMLGRHQVFLELPEEMDDYEDFTEILSNSHLNTHFLSLGREVGTNLMFSLTFFFFWRITLSWDKDIIKETRYLWKTYHW